jgi:hypothetical protein
MTSRIIRDSALTSYSLAQLSGDAERLWWRLTLVADDYGRFNADPRVVCATCFPLTAVEMDPLLVDNWLSDLVRIGGIRRYEVAGHPYGYFVNWPQYQRPPRYRSKFPPPSQSADSGHQPLTAANSGSEGGQELSSEKGVDRSSEDGRYQPPIAAISGQSKDYILTPDQKASQAKAGPRSFREIAADVQGQVGSAGPRRSLSTLYAEELARRAETEPAKDEPED